jgi:DMSO/TMAO reductase YedYZ molybdopterin-dependent catalytic subunit
MRIAGKKESTMKKSNALAFAVLGALILAACGGTKTASTVSELAPAEIRAYEGRNLSSINDFADNSIAGPQNVALDTYHLEINGAVDKPLSLTYDQVLANPAYRKVVTLHCVEGWDVTILWQGVLIDDLLAQAGVKPDAVTVIFHAADGYTTSLSLDAIRQNKILLAYKMNDITIPPGRGFPFMVVAESKWGYKWAKWVTGIELSTDPNYRGYWEQNGYNNNGEQSGPMFEQ